MISSSKMSSCHIINIKRRDKKSDFVDMQVIILLQNHQDEENSIKELCQIAKEEMHGDWDEDKIRNSLNRLEKRDKVASKQLIKEGRTCRVPYLL